MSLKRSPEASVGVESGSKRVRRHALHHKQPGALLPLALPQDGSLLELELDRTLCLALHAAGFDGVKTEALESFRAHVESYMTNFALWVNHTMRHARRAQPIPADFAFTLARFGLSPSTLAADLRLSVPTDVTQRPIVFPSFEPATETDIMPGDRVFSQDVSLSGAVEKRRKKYIPKHFPDFPSQHTYRDTPVMTQRETDARRLREQSTQEGMLAEQALRRLMAARQRGSRKIKGHGLGAQVASKAQQESDAMFQEALNAMVGERNSRRGSASATTMADALDSFDNTAADSEAIGPTDVDFGAIVNYDRVNWRKGAADWISA